MNSRKIYKYRDDGAWSDALNRFVTFNKPQKPNQRDPGLNCSGFIHRFWQEYTGYQIPLEEASFDRLNDSQVDSPKGHDWDFALDLILNLDA